MTRMHVLMSKAGAVAHRLALELSAASAGDRMPTVQDLSERHQVGKGTVQAALALLEEAGAVEIRPRGKLGTFVTSIDHRLLWEMAGGSSVSVAMPLPYSRRYEGLATGLHAAFIEVGVPLTLMFVGGAADRAAALHRERADFAVMSRLAAEGDPELAPVVELLRGTEATTVHRLLGWAPGTRFRHAGAHPLPHDLVVVDETSMVALPLMARLLDAVRPDARLVLVGDPYQLASVAARPC